MTPLIETLKKGSLLNNNRYQLKKHLGRGGEADVFLVKDKNEHNKEYFIFLRK